MTRPLRRFARDEDGAILALFAVLLALFLGLVAISFDFGRQAATQSELQSFADNVALAAAGELDGAPDSLDRARAAAATFVTDSQTFGDGPAALTAADDVTLTFYRSAKDAGNGTNPQTKPNRVRFVRATVDNRRVRGIFAPAFTALIGGDAQDTSVGARAVAGYSLYACNVAPMTFCAPTVDFKADLNKGVSLDLTINPGTGNLVPGTLSLVENAVPLVDLDGVCKALTGINLDLCLLGARGQKTACLSQDGIDIAQGNRLPTIKAALNVRFDIFAGTTNSLRNNPLYAPAANVLSSYVPSNRNSSCIGSTPALATDRVGLPRDDCQASGSCGIAGNATWTNGRAAFVAKNFGGNDPFPQAKTRFEFYNAMVAAQAGSTGGSGSGGGGLLGGVVGTVGGVVNGVTDLLNLGRPICAPAPDPDPARRIIVAAAIDCTGLTATADTRGLPVLDFVELFMTSPVGLGGAGENALNVEVIGSLATDKPNHVKDMTLRDIVRLHR